MESNADEKRVIDYLNQLMSGRFFQIKDLEALTAQDLKVDTPLQDIDGTILETTLKTYKEKYKSEIFKDTNTA